MKAALIVFQKNLVQGKVKTRLAASIGDEKALKVYIKLLGITHTVINELSHVSKRIYFSDEIIYVGISKENTTCFIQRGNDLGARLLNAFKETFDAGYTHVIVIGTDCPELNADIIHSAFEALEQTELVLGPTRDGGYYLLGMSSMIPDLFTGIPWSTSEVARLTLKTATRLNVSHKLLKELSDLDDLDDYQRFKLDYFAELEDYGK